MIGAQVKRPPNFDRRSEADSDVRLQALTKQLSQLDVTSSKLGETLKFISEFNKDNGGAVLGSHAPQQLQQLQQLRQRLTIAVREIEQLQVEDSQNSNTDVSPSTSSTPKKSIAGTGTAAGEDAMDTESTTPRQLKKEKVLLAESLHHAAANDGGTVSGTVTRITREAAEESAATLTRVKEEQRRLMALKKELADLQKENEIMSKEISTRDIRALREKLASQQAQLKEIQSAEDDLKLVQSLAERLPIIRAELEVLKPVAEETAQLEAEVCSLKELDTRRVQLSRDIATLQPKVMLVEKMQVKVSQLEDELQKAEELQTRVTVLQAEADKLPALRTRMYSLQASAAEARQLEKLMQDYGRQEELLVRLQNQEQEMQARVAGIEDLKRQVEVLKFASSEADQLEVKFASLATAASRLPVLRSQVSTLEDRCAEVAELEVEVEKLEQVEEESKALRRRVEELRPQAEEVERLKVEVHEMQQAVVEAEELRAKTHSSRFVVAQALTSPGSVLATAQAISSGRLLGEDTKAEPELSKIEEEQARLPIVQLTFNIVQPEPPLLPPGVSAELFRKQEEVRALKEAHAEMADLETHQGRLQQQLEELKASTAAAEVIRLQAQLLEMQSRDVQELTAEVEGLAGVSEKLAALKEQHRVLEQEADEAFVLQAQLPELEAAAAQVGVLRRRRDALEAERVQALSLMESISEAEAVISGRSALEVKLASLYALQEEVEHFQSRLEQRPAIEAKLSRLRAEIARMDAQAEEAVVLQADLSIMRRQMALAAAASTTFSAAAASPTPAASTTFSAAAASPTPAVNATESQMAEGCGHVDGTELVTAADPDVPLLALNKLAAGKSSESTSIEAHALEGVSSDDGSSPKAVHGVEGGWQLVTPSGCEEDHDSSMVTAHLEQVRARHAALVAQRQELLQLTAESQLLMKDNEVLRMQLNVAVAMYSSGGPAASSRAPADKAVSGDDSTVVAASREFEQVRDSGDLEDGQEEQPHGVGTPLGAVFQRLRVLESENMSLQARNEELKNETDSLRSALEASLNRLDAFKGLAATVGMIRGKKHEFNPSLAT
ncbi:hypothetical protein CEUSTIGMA_g7579.t1 [Chlamydomonas eustigma]|uniref:Uncharacterized protein n=1 Tax=Chlamydomonas eustigma TaxID=1157962 RepID=A0A250XAM2_9CHLO|nr:hypothetical protein CEUSTIGMA_g7579.t1 [Chlamydomonas eustigma]|eukprot:GAX80141.1 hypothetical protein CEUSTIGMA_g7579.t1 [Chlamydomonas eustigma]